jgi:methionine sulfoxide reductase heme-binding subunit
VALDRVAMSHTTSRYSGASAGASTGVVASRRTPWTVWCLRLLVVVPFVFMARELVSAITGNPLSAHEVSASAPDVLGNGAFILFALMLAVTPVRTITGWRWHLPLRRDFGIATFAVAGLDLVLIAVYGASGAHGGFLDRVAGQKFLLAGTLAVVLLLPLVLSSTRSAKRWLGRRWKLLHRLTYAVWALILLHLAFIPSLRAVFFEALVVSLPLAVMRVPPLERWWSSSRRSATHRGLRILLTVVVVSVFLAGFVPFVVHFAEAGSAALSATSN